MPETVKVRGREGRRDTVDFVSHGRRKALKGDPEAMRVLEVVARAFEIPVDVLLDRSRPSDVAHARQIAIYLIHTTLHRTILDATRVFGRDRTTGSYACARVEERREDPAFDREVGRLEEMIASTAEEEDFRAVG